MFEGEGEWDAGKQNNKVVKTISKVTGSHFLLQRPNISINFFDPKAQTFLAISLQS